MNSEDNFTVIRYNIELQSPVLATDVMGEPNSAVSLPSISGTMLRGALIERYRRNRNDEFDAGDADKVRKLFFDETTRFLNAYPLNLDLESRGKGRALPIPRAWRYNKEDYGTEDIHDLSRKDVSFQDQAVDEPFFWRGGGEVDRYSPPRRLNVHTQRDARMGRSTEDSGAIYRYEALAPGIQLQALVLTVPALAQKIEALLRGATLWIGRARRAGYGRAVVTEVNLPEYWRESGTDDSTSALEQGEVLRVNFTSDALLRDENGQATLDPRRALEAALELPDQSLKLSGNCSSWAEPKIVGGFNRKWGLPLPQTVALAAGSIFAYRTNKPIDGQKLVDLERLGIGERRAEGFGRVLMNWLDVEDMSFSSYEASLSPKAELRPLSSEELEQARAIAKRILRHRLDKKLVEEINQTTLVADSVRHKTQLSRLRVILRSIKAGREYGEPDIERLKRYLDDIQKRRSARDKFEQTKVDENSKRLKVLDWIRDQLAIIPDRKEEETLEDPLGKQEKATQKMIEKWKATVELGKGLVLVTAAVDERIAREYGLRLVDQVIYRAMKDEKNAEESEGRSNG